jgi:serine phosphatase RsbU (regulator of sigma subunit)
MPNKTVDLILCVDDEPNVLNMFQRTLGRKFNLLTATSAAQALGLFKQHPNIAVIISDYNMPGMDGLALLKQVMQMYPHTVQIMLTGNINIDISIQAINETEIFRYLPKPCPTETLQKVTQDALNQYHLYFEKQRLTQELAEKNQALLASNTELEKQKYLLETELEMAKTVFRNVVSYHHIQLDGLDYRNYPKAEVGGDFLLSFASEDKQSLYLMMGDLTGHGLQSALAIILVADSFDSLCQTQLPIEELAKHITTKMCSTLPVGLFCAAALIKLDLTTDRLHIWQGGIPDIYLLDAQNHIIQTLLSNNLPLGISSDQNFTGSSREYPISAVNNLFLCTDGVSEQLDMHHQPFGDERLQAILMQTPKDQSLVDKVTAELRQHQQQAEQMDDISMLAINIPQLVQALRLA